LNTINGVKGIEPNLIRAARCLGASEVQILWRIVVKAALPQIVTGIRIGLGVGWMALVAAELVGANSGLGFLINDARTVLRTDYIIVGMASIGVIGLLLDQIIRQQDLPRPQCRRRAGTGAGRCQLPRRGPRVLFGAGPQRLRQDHAADHDGRLRAALDGKNPGRWQAGR
jgi:hypothetical protein